MEPIRMYTNPGSLVILRVTILSKIIAPVVIQPDLGHWVSSDGSIFPADFKIEPAYSFLQTGGIAEVTFSIKVPKDAPTGNTLHGSLNIPSAETYSYPLLLDVIKPKTKPKKVYDFSAKIEFPIASENEPSESDNILISKTTVKLLAGLASMEVIPSKWIFSELVLGCCNTGYKYISTDEGSLTLRKLSRTRFYKNGILIFQGTQFMQWIKLSHAVSSGISSFTGGDKGNGLILQNWEEWLFNIIDQDIESPEFEYEKIEFPDPTNYTKVLEIMETDADKWFSYFIIGLMKISPRIDNVLQQMIAKVELETPKKVSKPKKPGNVLKEKGTLQR